MKTGLICVCRNGNEDFRDRQVVVTCSDSMWSCLSEFQRFRAGAKQDGRRTLWFFGEKDEAQYKAFMRAWDAACRYTSLRSASVGSPDSLLCDTEDEEDEEDEPG
jgi:hypothetical protein